jgi:Zn-dependent M32 family carboxypeptidase
MDVHWINGYFGYFPSYMIAHVIAAQLGEHGISFAKDIELLETMSSLDYVAVVTGEKLNPDYFKRIWEY